MTAPDWQFAQTLPQLKDLIKESVKEAEAGGDMISYSPRTTSLSVARAQTQRDAAEERFFKALDAEVRPEGFQLGRHDRDSIYT